MRTVVLLACPSCAGLLHAAPGVSWMACASCASAWDPFADPPERVPTFRPVAERGVAGPRLPFYVFGARGGAGERPVWVPAYRAPGERSDSDVASLLTEKRHGGSLVEAPLGAAVARGPREARALLSARQPAAAGGEVVTQALVSVSCRVEREWIVEPISGAHIPIAGLFPRLATMMVP